MKASLPLSIQDQYRSLRTCELNDAKRAKMICQIFLQVASFLGKLALLEYLQGNCQSATINYWLMQNPLPDTPREWIKCFDRIHSEFARQKFMPVVRSLIKLWEKYPGLRLKAGLDDRIARLLWFYELLQHGDYLVLPADIQENEEYLAIFWDEFSFLETARYREENEETVLVILGQKLQLSPFYRAHNDRMGLSTEQESVALEKACKIWIPEELRQYHQQKSGKLDFDPTMAAHRDGYILAPWVEAFLEEALENIFATVESVASENTLSIEGHPGSGKTALVANLSRFFEHYRFFCYFIRSDSPLQTSATFEKWLVFRLNDYFQLTGLGEKLEGNEELLRWLLTCRQAFAKESPKIVVAVDGIENMPATEYVRLRSFIRNEPLNRMVFLFFKRVHHTSVVPSLGQMSLQCKDNIRFEETFVPEYIQQLRQCYLNDDLAMKIFTLLAREPQRFFSVVELATATETFTPKVLKTLLHIKPLCEISREIREYFPTQLYRVFHPICQNFFG